MTYPPQPGPYPGAGGYGQPYPRSYPQSYPGQHPGRPDPAYPEYRGQFPNQPYQGQSGGYGQPYHDGYSGGGFSHQQPGYGMPPGYGSPPPPPEPPKRGGRTGLIVGIALVLVLLAGAAVGITGFWQPGYFRDDSPGSTLAAGVAPSSSALPPSTSQQPDNAAPTTTAASQAPPASGSGKGEIRRIADAVVAGINNRDAAKVKPVSCDPRKERQADYDGFPDDLTVSISGEPRITGDSATVPLTLRRSDTTKQVTLTLRRPADGSWCAAGIDS